MKYFSLVVLACSIALAQNQPPKAVITALNKTIANNQISVAPGEQVQFIGNKSSDPEGAALSYFWEFGDGQTSTLAVPKHTYTNAGTYTVKLTVDDGFIALPPPGPNPLYPNEPAGYLRWLEHDFSCVPRTGCTMLGNWGGNGFPAVQTISDAPKSPDKALRITVPNGLVAGNGFAHIVGRGAGELRETYFSFWMKIEGSDYENQTVGTKILYFGYAEDAHVGNQGFLMLKNSGINSSFTIAFMQQNNVSRNMYPNVNGDKLFTVGVWHRIEVVMKLNALGSANGLYQMWIDNKMTHWYNDVVYITNTPTSHDPTPTAGFFELHMVPIWGGVGGVRTRNDYWLWDHVYMSGIPK